MNSYYKWHGTLSHKPKLYMVNFLWISYNFSFLYYLYYCTNRILFILWAVTLMNIQIFFISGDRCSFQACWLVGKRQKWNHVFSSFSNYFYMSHDFQLLSIRYSGKSGYWIITAFIWKYVQSIYKVRIHFSFSTYILLNTFM